MLLSAAVLIPVGFLLQARITFAIEPTIAAFARYAGALAPVLAGYQRENKSHATIAVGCTGGKHRSVALVERLAGLLGSQPGVAVRVKHRDLGRE